MATAVAQLDRSPNMRKVVCLNHSRDRPRVDKKIGSDNFPAKRLATSVSVDVHY